MGYEWDVRKNDANVAKHGIDFAIQIFDGSVLVRSDTRRDYGERRWVALGRVQDETLTVV